jgi:hypothetical protein
MASTSKFVALVVLVAFGVVGAAALGVGPVPSSLPSSGDAPGESAGTGGAGTQDGSGDTASADGGGSSGGDATATPKPAPFGFRIDSIEGCGTTCRDVTATLTNRRESGVDDVTVTTRIYVQDDRIWQGSEEIGRLDAGESATTTKRVDIGYFDAAKIQNNDGYVTVETTVQSSAGTYTFSGRRQVA